MALSLFGGPEARLRKAFAKAARDAPSGPLAEYYAAGLPDFALPLSAVPMTAIDLETDGLEARDSAILEAGLVDLADGRIAVGSAGRIRFRPPAALSPDAVTIHGITDDALEQALPEAEALAQLLQRLVGRVLVAHFAQIEAGFLDAACRRVWGQGFVAPFVCTMQLEQRWFPRPRAADGLRLGKLRSGYGLPHYGAHDGVTDALACAELLLAQIAHRPGGAPRVGDLLRR
ncbi:MAG: hypothetical protein IE933_05485 [Sphingomonadales bacterium]|nr:hypothetical protein [Sphingomonadales bacterium]MBD3773418.1 hypothetical protein [Paracoccaceae bacterium]